MKPTALLVTSPAKQKNNFWTCSITSPVGSLMPPCDLTSIAAVLRKKGVEPVILDIRLFNNPLAKLMEETMRLRPQAIITNLSTASAVEDYEIFHLTRDMVPKRIAFAFHAMALPQEAFSRGVTHILAGDPEYAAAEAVLGTPSDKGLWTPEDFSSEPGFIDPLDQMPFPALDLIDVGAYHSLIMGRDRFSILLANRGCPYSCTYCVIPFQLGRKYRSLSPERVVAEMERDYRAYGVRKFFFIDSAVNIRPDWLMNFTKELIARRLDVKWCANMRVHPVETDMLAQMKRSGCFRVFLGVEDLDMIEVLNRKTDREQTVRAFRLCREAGVETVAFTILNPGIDKDEHSMAMRIVSMVSNLGADALQCNISIPFPGSPMYAALAAHSPMTTDWTRYDPAGDNPPYENCGIDLVKARRLVYLRYFLTHPKTLWHTFTATDFRSLASFAINSCKVLWGNAR